MNVKNIRLAVLGSLAVCALVIAGSAGGPEPDLPPPIGYSITAIGLAVVSILTRLGSGGARTSERSATSLVAVSLACAAAIGVLAVLLTLSEGQWRTGLFYTLAGAMLSIRVPSTARPASDDSPADS